MTESVNNNASCRNIVKQDNISCIQSNKPINKHRILSSWNPAVLAINGYQKYISPYKGFCCAHRVVTGEESCSEYVKQAIIRKGLFRSFGQIRKRFRDCKESAIYLNELKSKKKDKDNKKKDSSEGKDSACLAAEALTCIPSGCADISVSSVAEGVGGVVSGGCDGCACTPF